MKNIHVLPTGKPSSIGYDGVKNLHFVNDFIDDYQNIYITSDEEIKEGDWVIFNELEIVKCNYSKNGEFLFSEALTSSSNHHFSYFKKIILTTDQDLIKDGVQAIDDEFLEWFVKNSSCEYIEIENVYDKFLNSGKRSVSDFRKKYKIIIPKEEPKQCELCNMYPRLEGTNKCESCYSVVRHVLEQDPELKDNLLPDLRKKQETSSVGAENQIFKIVLDEKWRPNKVSMIETDNNSVLNKQETLEEITEQIQNECHSFVESVPNVTYQDATNTFLFMKLAELTLKLKKYE